MMARRHPAARALVRSEWSGAGPVAAGSTTWVFWSDSTHTMACAEVWTRWCHALRCGLVSDDTARTPHAASHLDAPNGNELVPQCCVARLEDVVQREHGVVPRRQIRHGHVPRPGQVHQSLEALGCQDLLVRPLLRQRTQLCVRLKRVPLS